MNQYLNAAPLPPPFPCGILEQAREEASSYLEQDCACLDIPESMLAGRKRAVVTGRG